MAQNITLLGASYPAVPAVVLPKTGGGSATFTDVTDTTATADDVASGKYFYTAAGVRTEGTSSGGGGGSTTSVTIGSQFPYEYLYYVDGTGTAQTIHSSGAVTITCLSKSLIVGLFTLPPEPMATPIGATVYAEISLGSRANYKYLIIFQAN